MIWHFAALYCLVGFLVSITIIMVMGEQLLLGFDILARHDGIEIGPTGILLVTTIVTTVAWPFMLCR